MIDIHSHVLSGIDDGAADTDSAIALLRQYGEQGVTTVVCTPHLLPQTFASIDTLTQFLDTRDAKMEALQAEALRQGMPVQLVPGTELMLTTAMIPYLRSRSLAERIAINNGSYVLVELPHALTGGLRTLEGLLFEIQLTGLVPILAHPERTAHNEGVMPVLRKWVEDGRTLLQVNAGHLADDQRLSGDRQARYRARQGIVWRMLREGMVCVIASDAHDPEARPVQGEIAYWEIERQMGSLEAMRLMVENPARVVGNKAVG